MKIISAFEINEQYLKMLVARVQGRSAKLADCRIEQIKLLNDEQTSQLVGDVLHKTKFKTKNTTICLPRNSVTVRNLHLPSQETKEITQMIDLHIGRIVPYKKEETVFGYQVLGKDEMGYTKVILAIAHIANIRKQIKILENAGLYVDKVALSSYGIWRWVLNSCRTEINPKDLYLLLDVDTTFTDFIIFSQEHLMFSRSITVGSDDIRENEVSGITKLIGELKQSLIIFYNEEINKKPVKAFIGGAKNIGNLIGAADDELGMPVKEVVRPTFRELHEIDKNLPENVSFTGVADLVLSETEKRIYFALPEIQIRRSLREKTKDLVILGSFVIYCFTVICAIFLGKIYNQQNYLKALQQRSGTIDKEFSGLTSQLNKITFVKAYLYEHRLPLFVISQLQNAIPQEVSVTSLKLDEKKVILRGEALQLSDIFKLVTNLEQSKYFKNVQTKYTRKKKFKEREITDFEIDFNLAF
ncbi:MAG: pilus assembly protein PilM [Candidatus Omnitrophica bacterium]|nr:pilus assembly protein PilM [Candidatus Omnitrophota bacterium]